MVEKGDNCEDIKFYAPADTFGGVKPAIACGEEVVRIPDELVEPEGTLPEAQTLLVPQPLRVWNRYASYQCKDSYSAELPDGTPNPNKNVYDDVLSVVEDGVITDSVSFAYLDLTAEQLDYIARTDVSFRFEQGIHQGVTYTVVDVAELFRISVVAAKTLLDDTLTKQTQVDTVAITQAQSNIVCFWWNYEQAVDCKTVFTPNDDTIAQSDYATSKDHSDAVSRSVIQAKVVKSYVGQEEANTAAKRLAESALNCFFLSDAIHIECTDSEHGYTEPVPNDVQSIVPGLKGRRGVVDVAAGTFISTVSKEDANTQAKTYAESLLNCYYVNEEVSSRCAATDARSVGIDPTSSLAISADAKIGLQGQYITIPAGSYWSDAKDATTAQLTYEAQLTADSVITCCFVSPPVQARCLSIKDPETGEVLAEADPVKSINYELVFPAGMYTDCLVGADRFSDEASLRLKESLVQKIKETAEASLSCTYCNVAVPPACVPEWVLNGVESGELTLPLNVNGSELQEYYDKHKDEIELPATTPSDDENGNKFPLLLSCSTLEKSEDVTEEELKDAYIVNVHEWSESATIGINAGAYCTEIKDPEDVDSWRSIQQIAETAAATRVTETTSPTGDVCYFGNYIILGGCERGGAICKPGTSCEGNISEAQDNREAKKQCRGCSSAALDSGATCGESITSNNEMGCMPDGTPYINATRTGSYDFASGASMVPANVVRIAATSPEEYASAQQRANEEAIAMANSAGLCGWMNCRAIGSCDTVNKEYDRIAMANECSNNWEFGPKNVIPKSHLSKISTQGTIVVEEGVFISFECKNKTYEATRDLIQGLLYCVVGNEEQYIPCTGLSSGVGAVIAKDTVYAFNRKDANAAARDLAYGTATCMPCNTQQSCDTCQKEMIYDGESVTPTLIRAGVVSQCSIVASSVEEANALAHSLACSLAICIPTGLKNKYGPYIPTGGGGGGSTVVIGSCTAVYA